MLALKLRLIAQHSLTQVPILPLNLGGYCWRTEKGKGDRRSRGTHDSTN
jgi:hypothetical protein